MDDTFKKLLDKLKEFGYYVIQVVDDDRYLWEVYVKDEIVCIVPSVEEAYMKLGEFVQNDFSIKPIKDD